MKETEVTNETVSIFPSYYDLTIPPNIAPLNFVINEPGTKYRVEISAGENNAIVIKQSSQKIKIPEKKWHHLLEENKGHLLHVDIWVYQNKTWKKYNRISHQIAKEPIDSHLVYRLVHAVYLKWNKMGIYQRNLTNFDEEVIIENNATQKGCFNCHSFASNDPSKMIIHFRIVNQGTLLWNDGELKKIDTGTPVTKSAGIYPGWHPNGKCIAFSAGKIVPHLTTRDEKVVDVTDLYSDLIIYDVDKNKVISSPELSTKNRENMPVWSADGKYLYFISAPEAKGDNQSLLYSKYSLMRVAYYSGSDTWGEPEMVLSSEETGKTISMPSVSPNGKYLICSMSDYGYFTIFHKESDLYSFHLGSGKYKKMGINSNSAESYSSWSSNSRWIVFSSKRIDYVFTRPFIAYFDSTGVAHTPFVLPQKDPTIYERSLANYNRPELVIGEVELSPIDIRNIILKEAEPSNYSR
jgi:hypothetical protein